MRGAGWAVVLVAALLPAAGSCQRPAREPAMDGGGTQTGGIVLTGLGNEARFRLVPDSVPEPAGRLTFTVDRVANPDGHPIDLAVSVQVGDAVAVPVGSVALFPVDQGGRFTLRLPLDAVAALSRGKRERGPVVVTVTLTRDSTVARDQRTVRVGGLEVSPP